jgi:CBS domain-containing protein
MVTKRVNRLPVVDDDGRLVGIITRADLVRAFNRPDTEIEAEIRDQVLIRTMWIDPKVVELRVEDGDVVLTGHVQTRSAAEIVESYIRRVPGVVAVSCVLTWSVDDRSRQAARSL